MTGSACVLRFPLAVLLVLTAGCGSVTDAGDATVDLRGSWRYTAQQTSGDPLAYTGTLVVATRSGSAFGGSITVEESNARGAVRTIAGVAGGRVYSNGLVDIDVALEAATLRHVASLTADTLHGNWTTTEGLRAGTFRAVRTVP